VSLQRSTVITNIAATTLQAHSQATVGQGQLGGKRAQGVWCTIEHELGDQELAGRW